MHIAVFKNGFGQHAGAVRMDPQGHGIGFKGSAFVGEINLWKPGRGNLINLERPLIDLFGNPCRRGIKGLPRILPSQAEHSVETKSLLLVTDFVDVMQREPDRHGGGSRIGWWR